MAPFREQPLDRVAQPPRYPAPDWTDHGLVTRVFVPDDDTVGWAVFQGETQLGWLSAIDPEHLGYPIRRHVEDLLREGALDKVPAQHTWDAILADTLHTTPQTLPLPDLLAEVASEWQTD